MGKIKDINGCRFGRLLVIEYKGVDDNRKANWLCECDCGNKIIATGGNLRSGNTASCGCFHNEELSKQHKDENFTSTRVKSLQEKVVTHNMSKTKFYKVWLGMKERCFYDKHKHYQYYGGKGIKVCDRWLDFNNFKEDMYDEYIKHVKLFGKSQTTIDRVDSSKDYEFSNCRWATWKQQNTNKKKRG